MNLFKKIKSWFQNTKPCLWLRVKQLSRDMRDLANGLERCEQDLWKETALKEDYRDRLGRYYDECIKLRKKVKKYNNLLKKCTKFKDFFGRNCKKFTLDMIGREEIKKHNVSKRRS